VRTTAGVIDFNELTNFESLPGGLPIVPVRGHRSLHYHSGTTAALMTLILPKTRRANLKVLQKQLNPSKPSEVSRINGEFNLKNGDINELARLKYKEFMSKVEEARQGGKQRVIIYNNRGNDVNSQTNSSAPLFDAFRNLVTQDPYNFAIVVINTGGPELTNVVEFDLFEKGNRGDGPTERFSPGIDPLVTCRFFMMIAEFGVGDGIFGMFSGRSGSCDVAAFNGVNCFYWDTPYINLAMYDPSVCASYGFVADQIRNLDLADVYGAQWTALKSKTAKDQKRSLTPEQEKALRTQFDQDRPVPSDKHAQVWRGTCKKYARGQLVQTYRTLQQYLIMAVGYPDYVQNTEVGKASWVPIQADPFHKWLKGVSFLEEPLFPRCPKTWLPDPKAILNVQPNNESSLATLRSWAFWDDIDASKKTKLASDLPDQPGVTFEAGGPGWAITADALRLAGFSLAEPKTEEEIRKALF